MLPVPVVLLKVYAEKAIALIKSVCTAQPTNQNLLAFFFSRRTVVGSKQRSLLSLLF
jgi:hypothetical protein